MKIVWTGHIALYGECKLTTADITVKTIGTIQTTRLPEYKTRLGNQLELKDLSQPEVIKLRKIIHDSTELMGV